MGDRIAFFAHFGKSLNDHSSRGEAGLFFTARIEGPPFHRGASASKKNGPAAPLARDCAFHDLGCPNLIRLSPTRAQMVPNQAGEWTVLHCAHRATVIKLNDPTKLACFPSLGRAPALVYMRPSNEALLRARVPGAQDQRGCPSNPFHLLLSSSTQSGRPPRKRAAR